MISKEAFRAFRLPLSRRLIRRTDKLQDEKPAIVRHMDPIELHGGASHSEVEATYTVIRDGHAV
jgi:hypothetical protein